MSPSELLILERAGIPSPAPSQFASNSTDLSIHHSTFLTSLLGASPSDSPSGSPMTETISSTPSPSSTVTTITSDSPSQLFTTLEPPATAVTSSLSPIKSTSLHSITPSKQPTTADPATPQPATTIPSTIPRALPTSMDISHRFCSNNPLQYKFLLTLLQAHHWAPWKRLPMHWLIVAGKSLQNIYPSLPFQLIQMMLIQSRISVDMLRCLHLT
jgi:hypothetical protein